jgi:hypothetical protein
MRRFPPANMDLPALHLTIIALGGMMDDMTRKLYSLPEEHTISLVHDVAEGPDGLAKFLSGIWFKALYPELAGTLP